jgi:hypothetical protein
MKAYMGLQAHLTRRIRELMASVRYSLILSQADSDGGADTESRFAAFPVLPCEIVKCTNAEPTEILRIATEASQEDLIVIMRTSRTPSAIEITEALESLIMADADVARPWTLPDPVIVRRDALPRLKAIVEKSDFEWEAIGQELQTAEFIAAAPEQESSAPATDARIGPSGTAKTADQVRSAWRGDARMEHGAGLGAIDISSILAGMLTPDLPTILILANALGRGGIHTHITSLVAALRGKANPLVCYGTSDGELRLSTTGIGTDTGMIFHEPDQLPAIVETLRRAGVVRADVHHIIGFEKVAEKLLDALDVPFDVTLIDYQTVVHNPYLADGRFAGDVGLAGPHASPLQCDPLPILRKASRRFALSRDLAARIERLAPGLTVTPVRLWHEQGVQMHHVFPPTVRRSEPLRVIIAGNISPQKGERLVNQVAHQAAIRNLPLRFHVLGQLQLSINVRQDAASFLTVHGPYRPDMFVAAIGGIAPHLGWIPSQVPETWSYVLADFMRAGLPVAAPACGAFPERCHSRPFTWLMPWDIGADAWIDLFLRLHAGNLREPPRWLPIDHLPRAADVYFEHYLHPERPITQPSANNLGKIV